MLTCSTLDSARKDWRSGAKQMSAFIDETGNVYGSLQVLEHLRRPSRVRCLCTCGTEVIKSPDFLRRGAITSCGGCLSNTIVGKVYGRLTVLRKYTELSVLWVVCKCACGTEEKHLRAGNLTSGRVESCGCKRSESAKRTDNKYTTHGMTRTDKAGVAKEMLDTYSSWEAMRDRCRPTANARHRAAYYDRGITVCERWDDFEVFIGDMGLRPPGRSLDRIDNNQGYYPGNCQWATPAEQMANTRQTHNVTIGGRTASVSEWSRRLGVSRHTVLARYANTSEED
ncbi:hypothetical protein UFOVP777_25 [uncultured Caudovirales phage]|uniref:Uncharacterized protein n=1 Tax=uncultured Caudovirales phage TaxID=2100421 RepID=A0A6J5NTN4_9CAUD|nr:hypothetical protein UFOVP777_25 [uncultured Caudovirales phage]